MLSFFGESARKSDNSESIPTFREIKVKCDCNIGKICSNVMNAYSVAFFDEPNGAEKIGKVFLQKLLAWANCAITNY